MENLKMFGIYAGSIAFLSLAAYFLSLHTVKTPFLGLPIATTTITTSTVKTKPIVNNASTSTSTLQVPSLKTATDTTSRYTFQYGEKFSGQYVSIMDWPPQVQILDQKYSCKIAERKAGDKNFCATIVENVVGQKIIDQLVYSAEVGSSTAIFTFSLQRDNCDSLSGE